MGNPLSVKENIYWVVKDRLRISSKKEICAHLTKFQASAGLLLLER